MPRLQITIDRANPGLLVEFWIMVLGCVVDHYGMTLHDPEGNEFCIA